MYLAHIDEHVLIFPNIFTSPVDIIETSLNSAVLIFEIVISGFSVYWPEKQSLDALERRKLFYKKGFVTNDFNGIHFQVRTQKANSFIGCVYKAPNESLEVRDQARNNYRSRSQDCVLIIPPQNGKRLLEFTVIHDLKQYVEHSTRVKSTISIVIDVLITSV